MLNSIYYLRYLIVIYLCIFCCFAAYPQHTTVKVDYRNGFDKQTDSILSVCIGKLDSVINTETFKQRVLNADFARKNGYTNKDIYDLIMGGKETWKGANDVSTKDYVWNLKLDVYDNYAGGGEVGITRSDGVTHTYKQYILVNGAACYAAHLAHEYCHRLGFTHPRVKVLGSKKYRSVPYLVGDIVAELLHSNCP